MWYNVLEAILVFPRIDKIRFYPALQSFGHSKEDVDKAIIDLSDKNKRLIEPVKISFPGTKPKGYSDNEYKLTDKGKYYLEIAKWPEYIELFQDYGRSLIEEYKS